MENNFFYQLWYEYRMISDIKDLKYTLTRETNKICNTGGPPVYNLGKSSSTGNFKLEDLTLLSVIAEDISGYELVLYANTVMKANIYITEYQIVKNHLSCNFQGTGFVSVPTELRYLVEITKKQHDD